MSIESEKIETPLQEVTPTESINTKTPDHQSEVLPEPNKVEKAKSEANNSKPKTTSTILKIKIRPPKPQKEESVVEEEEEESVAEFESSIDNLDSIDLDQQSPEELHKIYEIYQKRFKSSIKKSNKLFESLRNQNTTLSYYQRRNQSLLTILQDIEQQQQEEEQKNKEDNGDELMNRMKKIIEKMPRCKDSLIPFVELFENEKINKNKLIDLYVIEKIPDLINDDLVKLKTNPQNIENWCIRNNPNLINLNYKPLTIDNLQDYNGGTEYLLNLNDDFLSNQTSSHRKKRKLDKK